MKFQTFDNTAVILLVKSVSLSVANIANAPMNYVYIATSAVRFCLFDSRKTCTTLQQIAIRIYKDIIKYSRSRMRQPSAGI